MAPDRPLHVKRNKIGLVRRKKTRFYKRRLPAVEKHHMSYLPIELVDKCMDFKI